MTHLQQQLIKFVPPKWCLEAGVCGAVPDYRLPLRALFEQDLDASSVVRPTPIHEWRVSAPLAKGDARFLIKRDDLSSRELFVAGNKIRKLEFFFADAIRSRADAIISIGAVQSNHVRACAAVCRRLGIPFFGLLRGALDRSLPVGGNVACDALAGAHLCNITTSRFATQGPEEALRSYQAHVLATTAYQRPYIIPLGGSTPMGTWGYILAVQEILDHYGTHRVPFDNIVCSTGSGMFHGHILLFSLFIYCCCIFHFQGGTLSGLAIGAKAAGLVSESTGKPVQVHGVAVCDTARIFEGHVRKEVATLWPAFDGEISELARVHDQYRGLGYGKNTPEEMGTMLHIAQSTGVLLDPCYTLKGAIGMLDMFDAGRTLFVHTGGFLGLFNTRSLDVLNQVFVQPQTF